MYTSARDGKRGVAVGIFSGTSPQDADYQAAIDEIMATNRAAGDSGGPCVFAMLVGREVPPPAASWRKEFSNLNRQLPHAPHYMLLVTENRLARGVFTAVHWLTGTPPGHTYKAVSNTAEGDAWLTEELGEAYAVLARLEVEARHPVRRAAQG